MGREMAAEVRKFLGADHARLDELLTQTLSGSSSVDYEAWQAFRHGLLQHIAWEETILMVALRKSGAAKELCDRIRADHALLAALLVPPPRAELVLTARRILAEHNKVEEAMDGLYAQCLEVADDDELLAQIRAMPKVSVSPPRSPTRRAVATTSTSSSRQAATVDRCS